MTNAIGDLVWLRESNQWVEYAIFSQTKVSWEVGLASWVNPREQLLTKIPKNPTDKRPRAGWAMSLDERDAKDWVRTNSYRIGDQVGRCSDYRLLRAVANLIGYEE